MKNSKTKKKRKEYSIYQRCLFTLLVLIGYRVMCCIPVPGLNSTYFKSLVEANKSLGFLNMLSGSGLSSLSIMALNITPFISASIVVQLLQVAITPLKRLAEGSLKDRKRLDKITYCITALFAISQSIGIVATFGNNGLFESSVTFLGKALTVAIWTASSILVAVIGKLMGENKRVFVGNGTSLFLTVNIIAAFIPDAKIIYSLLPSASSKWITLCVTALIIFICFASISWICCTEKRVQVFFPATTENMKDGDSMYKQDLPIKLLPASVMPLIFVSTVYALPSMIETFFNRAQVLADYTDSSLWFGAGDIRYTIGYVVYVLLIFGFSYMYIDLFMNPATMAEDIQKSEGIIEGLNSPSKVSKFLKKQIFGMTTIGALVLSVIATIPFILALKFNISSLSFVGTSVLISVAIVLETVKEISSSRISEKNQKENVLTYEIKKKGVVNVED